MNRQTTENRPGPASLLKAPRGRFGYLKTQRIRFTVFSALAVLGILGIYFGAYRYFGTNQNYFTVLAAVLALPAAKLIVNAVLYTRVKGCSEALRERIGSAGEGKAVLWDMAFTSEKYTYVASHMVIGETAVIACTEDRDMDEKAASNHVRRLLQQNNIHGCSVQFTKDTGTYLRRLQEAESCPQPGEGKTGEIIRLLYSISL